MHRRIVWAYPAILTLPLVPDTFGTLGTSRMEAAGWGIAVRCKSAHKVRFRGQISLEGRLLLREEEENRSFYNDKRQFQ